MAVAAVAQMFSYPELAANGCLVRTRFPIAGDIFIMIGEERTELADVGAVLFSGETASQVSLDRIEQAKGFEPHASLVLVYEVNEDLVHAAKQKQRRAATVLAAATAAYGSAIPDEMKPHMGFQRPAKKHSGRGWKCKRCGSEFHPHRSPTLCDSCHALKTRQIGRQR